jgi:hypothetical protein
MPAPRPWRKAAGYVKNPYAQNETPTFRSCSAELALCRRALGTEKEAGQVSQHLLLVAGAR